MAVFGKKAILVPTPGQTEQEYLANYHQQKGWHYALAQKDFDLKQALEKIEKYSGVLVRNDLPNLKKVIRKLIAAI